MLRLSKLTDYATVVLSLMAREKSRVLTALEIATATGIPLPTVSKILKVLANAKLLNSTRGAKGGYLLAREPVNITIAAIISALEGPIALTECSLSKQICEQASGCSIKTNWHVINQAIYNALEAVTLLDLVKPIAEPTEVFIPVASLYQQI